MPIATLIVVGAFAGCGQEEPTISGRGLPTEQLSLVGDLCPTKLELRVRGAQASRGKARRQLRRLVDRYEENPDARVKTSFFPSEGGVAYETLTLRELVDEQLKAVPEGLEGDPDSVRCTERLDRRLRSLLEMD